MRNLVFTIALPIAGVIGCGETGQQEIRYPIYVSGSTPAPFAVGDWEVTLDVARIGFGPAYFCATAAASSDLCPTAVAEFASSAEANGVDPAPQEVGQVDGVTGEIRSATFDYAITWFATQTSPRPASAAPGGHSAHFEGHALRGTSTIRFVADVDVVPTLQGTRVVQGARLMADVQDDRVRLDVRFDPTAWWKGVDFAELEAIQAIDGDPVVVPKSSRSYNAIVIGMTATLPPTFEWSGI